MTATNINATHPELHEAQEALQAAVEALNRWAVSREARVWPMNTVQARGAMCDLAGDIGAMADTIGRIEGNALMLKKKSA